ncbi:NAD(P)-binding domain-containing protein [Nocardioides acrostichi]|uniref:Ornithine cyclodeaminase family protein n=1 Tax=Nocardioides acrostichi TaxID=2784339 RepID=A0A930UZ34_9ACTN|nr:NAD(P)-binding domain-containing protein [Nocardioides acrostichi]MBF4161039.1 ornithine cyclodeaminase family protein [Nocardioides acrostichi]
MTLLLDDDDVRRLLTPAEALAWTTEALLRHAHGALVSPARVRSTLGAGDLVFTLGASGGEWYGYRAYDTLGLPGSEQTVVLHDARTGGVAAVAIGSELGARRTGALGGVAMRALTDGALRTLAVIGTGRQAWAQVWAISGFVQPAEVRVFSRDPARRTALADRIWCELGLRAVAVGSAREAVTTADAVVLATSSGTPVVETDWLDDDVVVTTVGPKQEGRAEFARDLVFDAAFAVTDSPTQLAAYDPPALAAGLDQAPLADVVAGRVVPPVGGRRVYCSVGLAGTEIHLLGRLVAARRAEGRQPDPAPGG